MAFAEFVHHPTNLLVLAAKSLDFATKLSDDLAARDRPTVGMRAARRGMRITPIRRGGMLAIEPLDLLTDLLGLFVEPGGVEVLHGRMEMFDPRLQFGRARTIPIARCGQTSVQFVKLPFHLLGRIVATGLSQFVEFTFHLSEPLFALTTFSFAAFGTFAITWTSQTFVKLPHLLLHLFSLFVFAGPTKLGHLSCNFRKTLHDLQAFGIPSCGHRFHAFELSVDLRELSIQFGHATLNVRTMLVHFTFKILSMLGQFGANITNPLEFFGELVAFLFTFLVRFLLELLLQLGEPLFKFRNMTGVFFAFRLSLAVCLFQIASLALGVFLELGFLSFEFLGTATEFFSFFLKFVHLEQGVLLTLGPLSCELQCRVALRPFTRITVSTFRSFSFSSPAFPNLSLMMLSVSPLRQQDLIGR